MAKLGIASAVDKAATPQGIGNMTAKLLDALDETDRAELEALLRDVSVPAPQIARGLKEIAEQLPANSPSDGSIRNWREAHGVHR